VFALIYWIGTIRRGYFVTNEMMHFVQNLHHYLMFEVMECAWQPLEERLANAADLDQLIDAHDEYLQQIVDKVLTIHIT
jgi:gamma-tubulin complex component 3